MLIPPLASIVAELIDHCLESVVLFLWPFFFEHGKPLELSFKELHFGDLVTFMHDLEGIPNIILTLQELHLVVLLLTQRSNEYLASLGVAMDDLLHLHMIVVLIIEIWYLNSYLNNIPNAWME
jgi:hypothetical protein